MTQALAALAEKRIHAAGFTPTLVTGDGLLGHKDGADYDALVATCSVRSIPRSWLYQVREGGSITTALGGWMMASGLILLTVDVDGTATGKFTGDTIGYMLARPHERPPRGPLFQHPGSTRPTQGNPDIVKSWIGRFLAQLGAPTAELLTTEHSVILVDVATGSQAWTEPVGGGWTVHQHGPLRLWDQVEDATTAWKEAGEPDQSAFGMTVTDDAQTVWLGEPSGPSWQLPA
ncbi:hypothetical protein [Streptomyces sp. NPDC005283]|uniref:hypothetical protein n=1 Tax=Streptomyces sp. NPDC005283 TaxID=3156871 RepID=UPI00345500B3